MSELDREKPVSPQLQEQWGGVGPPQGRTHQLVVQRQQIGPENTTTSNCMDSTDYV